MKITKDQYKTIKIHPDIHYVLSVLIAKRARTKITEYAEEALYKQMIIDFGEKAVTEVESTMPTLTARGFRPSKAQQLSDQDSLNL